MRDTLHFNSAFSFEVLLASSFLPAEVAQPASKRPKLSQSIKPSAIVLDIEGTITPISFVTETLFPYAKEHLEEHLHSTFESQETQADIALLQEEVRAQQCKIQ